MLKNSKSKILASAFCASVMVGLYAAPVFAAPAIDDSLKVDGTISAANGQFVVDANGVRLMDQNGSPTVLLKNDGSLTLTRDLTVVGGAIIGADLTVNKNLIIGEHLTVGRDLNVKGNISVDGDVVTKGTINGATIDGKTFNGVDVEAMSQNVAGIEKGNNETIIEGKVHVNSVGNIVTDGAVIARNGFSVGEEGTFTVNAANGDIVTKGKINGVKIVSNPVGDAIINGNIIGFDGITATGGLTVGLLEKKFGVDANGNVTAESYALNNGAFSVAKDGTLVSKVASSSLYVGADQVGMKQGLNSVVLDGNGVFVGDRFGSNVVVNGDGATFSNGKGGTTVINGGSITASGNIQAATFNGINIEKLQAGVEASGKHVAGITRRESVVEGEYVTEIEGKTMIASDGAFSTATGAFQVAADGTLTSKVGNSKLYVGADQVGMMQGANSVVLDNNGVLLGNAFGSNVRVTEDGVTFANGEAGTTIINGGSISNGKFSVDKDGNIQATTYNGINLEELKANVEASGKNVAGITRRESVVEGKYVTEIEGKTMIASDGTFSTASGKFLVDGATGDVTLRGAATFNGAVNLGSKASFTYGDKSVSLGGFYQEFQDRVGALEDKTEHISKDENGTHIGGDLIVDGNATTGGGNIGAGSGDIGGVKLEDGKVTADQVVVGNTVVSDKDVVINKGQDNEVSLSGVNNRVESLEQGVANVNSRINEVDEKIDKVGAMAAAIANLRTMGYDPEAPTEIAVGIGQYKDETGAALGIFHYPNRDFMLSMSVSTSGDEVMGGIGATWKFGRKSSK